MLRAGESACIQRYGFSLPEASQAREVSCAVFMQIVSRCARTAVCFSTDFTSRQRSAEHTRQSVLRRVFQADGGRLISNGSLVLLVLFQFDSYKLFSMGSLRQAAVGSTPAYSRLRASAAYRFFMENAKSVCAVNAQKTHN